MDDLERQKAEIMARMAEAPADVPDIHPNIAEIYRAKVVHLTEALADPELHSEAADAIRSLVGEVVLTPGEKRGAMQAVLRGELRSEEHTSELQSLMRISYAVFCLKQTKNTPTNTPKII